MLPKISVVTPSFNQGDYLEETIVSVLSQNYPNLEYILIDGGSTDRSVDIIQQYKKHFTFWISEKDSGQSSALNKGLRRATGDIVTWLNSDDVYLPGTLSKIANHFTANPESGLVYGKTIVFGKGMKEEVRGVAEGNLAARYLASMPFPQPSSFFRRRVLLEQGYLDESLHYGMDFDLLVRIALNYRIDSSPEIYSRYRIHPESKSHNAMGFVKDWNIVFSRVLRSVPGMSDKINQLKALNLYDDQNDTYKVGDNFDKGLIQQAYYYFLLTQAQMLYIGGESGISLRLFNIVKKDQPDIYRQSGLSGIHLRSFFLKPSLLKFIRSIKR